jgi:hypothetical protein
MVREVRRPVDRLWPRVAILSIDPSDKEATVAWENELRDLDHWGSWSLQKNLALWAAATRALKSTDPKAALPRSWEI